MSRPGRERVIHGFSVEFRCVTRCLIPRLTTFTGSSGLSSRKRERVVGLAALPPSRAGAREPDDRRREFGGPSSMVGTMWGRCQDVQVVAGGLVGGGPRRLLRTGCQRAPSPWGRPRRRDRCSRVPGSCGLSPPPPAVERSSKVSPRRGRARGDSREEKRPWPQAVSGDPGSVWFPSLLLTDRQPRFSAHL